MSFQPCPIDLVAFLCLPTSSILSVPTSWDSRHGGVGAPGRLLIGSDLENLIPCPWSRSRLPSDWGRRGTESWQHPALRTLVTMETESLDCSVNIGRAAASQKRSEEPHYWPLLDRMGRGGRSQVTGLPHHPISVSTDFYPLPPGVHLRGSGSRGLMLTQLEKKPWKKGHQGAGVGFR